MQHAFPSLEQMSTLSEERLFELGWGYRAPRFVALCAELQERGGDGWLALLREGKGGWEGARASLTELTGKLEALCKDDLCAVSVCLRALGRAVPSQVIRAGVLVLCV